jgi:hypothetical protein
MLKILFIPVSVIGGFAAGFIGKKAFEEVWGLIDEEEPPEPEHRESPWGKLIVAMALRGAIFQVTRGVVDRYSRQRFYGVTGTWPGEARPDPE